MEYTGTALTAVFHQPVSNDSSAVYETVRALYARTGRTLLPPLGFNNTFAILVRGKDARSQHLSTIDDAARVSSQWRAGFGYEFVERPDGYPGLAKAYGLAISGSAARHGLDPQLSRARLRTGGSDCRRRDRWLDQGPRPVPARRQSTLFPAVRRSGGRTRRDPSALSRRFARLWSSLSGDVSAADMRAMNYAADVEHRDVRAIVGDFLARSR